MLDQRTNGILLHITSLPNESGIGDLGQSAYDFIDQFTGIIRYWQILPLTSPIDRLHASPYFCCSTFAGNYLLIDLVDLVERGYLKKAEIKYPEKTNRVHWQAVVSWKQNLLKLAYTRFQKDPPAAFRSFIHQHHWLDDYVLFMTLVSLNNGKDWVDWPLPLRDRHQSELARIKHDYPALIQYYQFEQWLFSQQWNRLKDYAHRKGILFIGDIPFYDALQSVDVWVNQSNYLLDPISKRPRFVSGFPATALFPAGQLWQHPIYDWSHLRNNHYQWWINRLNYSLKYLYDLIRIDHFQGLYRYWQIPVGDQTATTGAWVNGPREDFLNSVLPQIKSSHANTTYRSLVFIDDAGEDHIQELLQLRDQFQLAGIHVLRFAWNTDSSNHYLPHHHKTNSVVYTSTHDTNTVRGWWEDRATEHEKRMLQTYVSKSRVEPTTEMIELALHSRANTAIIPLQDLLNLGTDSRMNTPGTDQSQNWSWRYQPNQLSSAIIGRYQNLVSTSGRLPNSPRN